MQKINLMDYLQKYMHVVCSIERGEIENHKMAILKLFDAILMLYLRYSFRIE